MVCLRGSKSRPSGHGLNAHPTNPLRAPHHRVLDWILGYTFFFFLFILSFVQVVDMLQGAILYNMRFAKSLQVGRGGGDVYMGIGARPLQDS